MLVDQHLTLEQPVVVCGVSRRTLQPRRSQGIGPRSFEIGQRRIAYRISDIERCMADRFATTSRGGA